jgi:molybdopterin/thiamine biosynthesis adenylyltransferase
MLIGCGGIGAGTALVLAKMGVRFLTLYDGDSIDEVNLATQFHRLSDVGNTKAEAVQHMCQDFADDTSMIGYSRRITPADCLVSPIVISAVDSIQARKDIWAAVQNGSVRWYIDARMAAEEFQMYLVDMETDRSWYDGKLSDESDETALNEACTAKATIFTASLAAGHIGSAVKAIAIRERFPRILIHNIRRTCLTVID